MPPIPHDRAGARQPHLPPRRRPGGQRRRRRLLRRSTRASSSAWSAPPAAARPRCCRWSPACSRRAAATSWSTARPISGPGPERGMVFQKDSVFPWMRVIDNVEYGLKCRGVRGRRSGARSPRTYLERVGLSHVEQRLAARTLRRHAEARRHRHRLRQWRQRADARRAVRRARLCHPPPAAGRAARPVERRRQRPRGAPCCSSPTTSTRRSAWPTASWSSTAAGRSMTSR